MGCGSVKSARTVAPAEADAGTLVQRIKELEAALAAERSARQKAEADAQAAHAALSQGPGKLTLDVQLTNLAGDTLARSKVDPTLCNGAELKRLIEEQAQESNTNTTGPLILVNPHDETTRISDREPLLCDRLGLVGTVLQATSTSTFIVQAMSHPMEDLANLQHDAPQPDYGSIAIHDGALHFYGHGELNVRAGVRNDAPLAWLEAPSVPVWTATVSCKLEVAHSQVISLFTVYDGPNGAGALGFSFGPRTWGGNGIGYQSMNRQDKNGSDGQHCDFDADPFAWHQLRMRKSEDANHESLYDLAYRPLRESAEEAPWTQCEDSVRPFRNLHGHRIALGLKQGSGGPSEIVFKDLMVCEG